MRNYRLLVSPRAAGWSLATAAALVVLFGFTPFSGAYLFFIVMMLFPFIGQIALTTAGLLPAIGTALIAFAGVWQAVGLIPALYALCYLLPLILLMAACLYMKLPYRQAMVVLILGFALIAVALFLMAQRAFDGDVFGGITKAAVDALAAMPDRDLFLNTFYRYGFLSLPAELAENPLVEAAQGYTFAPLVLEEFYKQAATRIDLWLRALLPMLISSYSINFGVLGFFISMFYGTRGAHREAYFATDDTKAEDLLPQLWQPAFSMWFIPRQMGFALFGAIVLWLLTRVGTSSMALSLSGQMLYNVAAALFSIQGLSFVNFVQKKRDTRPRTRGVIMVLLYLFLPMGMMMLGIYDQISNPRQLPRTEQDTGNTRGGMNP